MKRSVEFELIGDVAELKAKMEEEAASAKAHTVGGSIPNNGQTNGTNEDGGKLCKKNNNYINVVCECSVISEILIWCI